MDTPNSISFAYSGQTQQGDAISGTIDAGSLEDAHGRLQQIQVIVTEINPVSQSPRPRALRGQDFLTFNTQLAHLTSAGLPVEQGLRLIAEDMRSERLSETVRQIARDLESGRSLPQAFEEHSAEFPPLYSELVHAGMRTGNLSAILLNLGRHLELITRLRGALWKAISYPLIVFVSLLIVLLFLGLFVFPQFELIFKEFRTDLPTITLVAMGLSRSLVVAWPALLSLIIILIVVVPILWHFLSGLTRQRITEAVLFPLPLLGPALKRNVLARWCDALKLGIQAGVDLPAAITLAGQAVTSPAAIADGQRLIDSLNAGRSLDESAPTRLIPPTLIAVLTLSTSTDELPSALDTLGQMFQQQAELKMAMIPAILAPTTLIISAVTIGFVVLAMFAPIIALIQSVSSPMK